MSPRSNTSILGSLLREVTGEPRDHLKRWHENGGLGAENVLTAEVLQGLDFLPRQHFLGAVISELNGNVLLAREKLLVEIERASVSMLAERFCLRSSEKSHARQGDVRPDGILESPSVFCLIESKRKGGSFAPEQLAREFVIAAREAEAKGRLPMLMLILGEEPPVRVRDAGRQAVQVAILEKLENVRSMTEGYSKTYAELRVMVDTSVAWTTWGGIADIVRRQMQTCTVESQSVHDSIQRLADAVIGAIGRHGLS